MKDRTLPFFLLAIAITWTLQLPAVLARRGLLEGPPERFLPLVGLGALGPMIAAMLLASREPGGVRALFRRLAIVRMNPAWYAVALLTPGALLAAGMALYSLFGGSGRWLYPPDDAQRLIALLFFPLGEEVGWRGYALPRLLERRSDLAASVVVGIVWNIWHAMMFDLAGLPPSFLLETMPFFIAGSIFFTWLFRRTGGSLLIAVLAHVGAHLNNSHRTLPADPTPSVVHTVAYCVLAVLLLAAGSSAASRGDERAGA